MGLEPAVFMACLTLMYYEYLFFEQLIASLEYKLLADFAHCSRYIDDICALHCTHLKQLKYQQDSIVSPETGRTITGIYPGGTVLTLNAVSSSNPPPAANLPSGTRLNVVFLDVEFFTCPTLQAWGHRTYNKRRDPIFDGTRLVPLPPAVSLLPREDRRACVLDVVLDRFVPLSKRDG